ncbi:putative Late nodulin [Medicago truncatula]|uniref:Putative Late nodulin n=1 Tax=Medicago truncatula TaxID=3880 RepID=A0A396JGB2_MEDTR|nr:putative Late nodulin [Medicago truncatula]
MAEVQKIVYAFIILISLIMVVTSNPQGTCYTFVHCYIKNGWPFKGVWRCNKGFCELVI